MKKKIVLLLLFCMFTGLIDAQTKVEDLKNVIWWKTGERLVQENFEQRVSNMETEKRLSGRRIQILEGYIFTGIDFGFQRVDKHITYEIRAFMDPEKSWLREENDKATLEHEQAHFDITEIYSRKLRKELKGVKSADAARRSYQRNFRELQDEQKHFDADHKSESGLTAVWKEKIQSLFEEYADWESTTVELNIP